MPSEGQSATVSATLETAVQEANHARYRPGQTAGHYESFFLRANHPQRPLAFWIRYTVFSPDGRPEDAIGELWAVYFDGETAGHVAAKSEVSLAACSFGASAFGVRVADAVLRPGGAQGRAASAGHAISWDMTFGGSAPPLFLLPLEFYAPEIPRAKSLVPLPMAVFHGTLEVDGRPIEVSGWTGSQNHNWGPRHTDHYAWGQVAGFDTHPESFLEIATARFRVGDSWTPFATPLVLRHRGQEFPLNAPAQAAVAKAAFGYFHWDFASETDAIAIAGTVRAPKAAFVGLTYYNPPGGEKHCLNTKIAYCELHLTHKHTGETEVLSTRNRAAFEILTDDRDHGVPISV
ncbi:MAG: hypothetical protein Q7T33_14955 [Dehalococcoidia bacterium]|nr:hypothetical protein [Dehalococcoidia bacterium]